MKLITTQPHQGEGVFPTFPKGTEVAIIAECRRYPHWLSCMIDGFSTYVPRHFVMHKRLVQDYNPTELVVSENEVVELLELHYQWALVKRHNEVGWLPCEILTSI